MGKSEYMVYKICEQRFENGQHYIKVLDDNVSEEEFNSYFENMKKISCFDRINYFLKMITYNGRVLQKHLTKTRTKNTKRLRGILELSNKYVFDFAASIGSLIDYVEKRLMKKQEAKVQDEFDELKRAMFNKDIYKFWYYMRNFVIHYDVPFTQISNELKDGKPDLEIVCKREHLLKYKEWKHAKTYISQLPEKIDIAKMIEPMLVQVYAYYLGLLFVFRENIVNTHKFVEQFVLRHKAHTGIAVMSYKTEKEYIQNKNPKLHFLQIDKISQLLADLGKHPNVDIRYEKLK